MTPPQYLYKYLSPDAARSVLEGRRLRWSTPATLNDPFDAQVDLPLELDESRFRQLALEKAWRLFRGEATVSGGNDFAAGMALLRSVNPLMSREQFEKEFADSMMEGLAIARERAPRLLTEIRNICSVAKFLCLSAVPDNPLMWAHYSDAHRGCVLVLKSGDGTPYSLARPIHYVENLPSFLDDEDMSEIFGGGRLDPMAVLHRHLFTKSKDWGYEQEWRVWAGDGRLRSATFEDVPFDPSDVEGIIVGARAGNDDAAVFESLARGLSHGATIRRARLERFSIRIE